MKNKKEKDCLNGTTCHLLHGMNKLGYISMVMTPSTTHKEIVEDHIFQLPAQYQINHYLVCTGDMH